MKILIKKLSVISLSILFYTNAHGDESDWTTVSMLLPTAENVMFTTEYVNPAAGACEGGARFKLEPSNGNYKELTERLVNAYSSERRIKLTFDASQSHCETVVSNIVVEN